MGQKTHPGGFRLNTTQDHYSGWYQKNWRNYSTTLERDYKLRTLIAKQFDLTNVVKIEIKQNYQYQILYINVFVEKPVLVLDKIETPQFDLAIQSILKKSTRYCVNLYKVEDPDANAVVLAEYIGEMLTKRVPFKRAVRNAIMLAKKNPTVKGIKVQISGRLNGAEIARSEWVKDGRMPLQTLRAEIPYVAAIAKTIYGILGVKVWIFKGEKLN